MARCMFCESGISVRRINAEKKIRGKIVTLAAAPVYYCEQCKETFFTASTLACFNYIRDLSLDAKSVLFKYEDINARLNKN